MAGFVAVAAGVLMPGVATNIRQMFSAGYPGPELGESN
jgi:hypothetical protein